MRISTQAANQAALTYARSQAMDTARGTSASLSSRQTGPTMGMQVSSLASQLGLSVDRLNAHLTDGGTLNFTADATGAISSVASMALRGYPLDEYGTPDFDAIEKAGGKVVGTIPPAGLSKLIIHDGGLGTTTVIYAADVTTANGDNKYVKGMAHQNDGAGSSADTLESLTRALGLLRDLPNSLADAMRRSSEYYRGPRSSINVSM